MGFSRQEYWSGLPFPSPRDLPNAGIEPRSPSVQADSLQPELRGKPKLEERAKQMNTELRDWDKEPVSTTMFESLGESIPEAEPPLFVSYIHQDFP